ncbi:MAG: hypothetical protein MUF83_05005 [Acidimicrobiales bacterium]|jgi:hypothetical protein|nr:hypothetical protein [Acidimicrobiales bacterium]
MRKSLATLGLAAGIAGGSLAGLALTVPHVSGAQETTTTQEDSTATTEAPDRSARISETLAPLVADGTLTQEQADAVVAALADARPEPGGPGRHGGRPFEVAATAIGIDVDDLRAAVEGGQTIAEVAQANGVDPQVVIDALVADLTDHVNQEVADGRHTQAEADTILADAADRASDLVNGELPAPPAGLPDAPG